MTARGQRPLRLHKQERCYHVHARKQNDAPCKLTSPHGGGRAQRRGNNALDSRIGVARDDERKSTLGSRRRVYDWKVLEAGHDISPLVLHESHLACGQKLARQFIGSQVTLVAIRNERILKDIEFDKG